MRNEDLKAYGHSKKGITLVELIVAMTLTSIFAVLCVMLINPIERTYRGTLKLARAQLLADTLIDSIRKECDDVRHDETSDVWITDLSGNDDGQLFSDGPANKASSGNTLVFRRNNNYTEAIYAGVGISDANYTAVTGNVLTPEHTAHSIDALKIAGSENMKAGYVHFGYYQAKEDNRGIFPIESFDYTNPVMAKTYGDFNVELKFYDLTLKDSKYPAYVMCKLTIMEKGKEVYSRSAVLCFAANGSGKGSGSHHPVNPTVRDIEVNVIWDDNGASANRPDDGLAFVLKNKAGTKILSNYSMPDVKASNTQRFVFKNIDASSGLSLVISPDNLPNYDRSITTTANSYIITYTRVNEVMLLPGLDFYNTIFRNHSRGTITGVVFAESTPENLDLVKNAYYSCNVAIDKKTDQVTDDYKLYMVKDASGNQTAYFLSNTGYFNGNPEMDSMFMDCYSITQFTGLNLINTSNTINMHRVFYNCKKVSMPLFKLEWNTSKVKTMDGMFRNFSCDASIDVSVTIDIQSFDFSNCQVFYLDTNNDHKKDNIGINKMFCVDASNAVSHIEKIIFKPGRKNATQLNMLQNVFTGCTNLKTIENFDNFNFSGVEDVKNIFTNCGSLTVLNMNNWNLSNVKDFGKHSNDISEFGTGLSGVKKLYMNNWNISSVKSLNKAFSGLGSLEEVYMSECKTNNNEEWIMTNMFLNCYNLKKVEMDGFVNSHCTSLASAFSGCSSLPEIDLSSWDLSGVTNMSYIFNGCSKLGNNSDDKTVSFEELDLRSCTTMQRAFYGCSAMKTLNLNKVDLRSCNNFSDFASNCSVLTDVGITNSNMTALTSFAFIKQINNVDLSGTTFGMTTISGTFGVGDNEVSNLKTIKLNRTNFTNCTSFASLFNNCKNLTSVEIVELYTPNLTNCSKMFQNCYSLSIGEGDISGWDTSKVTDMSYMFNQACFRGTGYGDIPRTAVLDLSFMSFASVKTFYRMINVETKANDALLRVILPSGENAVTNAESVNLSGMFRRRNNLTEIVNLCDFAVTNAISDAQSMLADNKCTTLDIRSLDITKIPKNKAQYMFNECERLVTIIVMADKDYTAFAAAQNVEMFKNDYMIRGQRGTTLSVINGSYARIDDPDNGKLGYFTSADYTPPEEPEP